MVFFLVSWYSAYKTHVNSYMLGMRRALWLFTTNPFHPCWSLSKETTLGGTLDSFRMGAGCQMNPLFQASWEEREGWTIQSITNGQRVNQSCPGNETATETLGNGGHRALELVNTSPCQEHGTPQLHRTDAWDPSGLNLSTLSPGFYLCP